MKPGTIVYTGTTKKGTEIVIRYPTNSDALEMTRFINTLSKEQTYITFQGEQNTVKEEEKYLRSLLKKIKDHKCVNLLVFHNDMMIGSSDIFMRERAEKHVGNFGLAIAKEYRGEGIGTQLMKMVLQEAETQLPDLKICVLGVFGDNELALSMYQKFGFTTYGTLPDGMKHKDQFVEHILMYKTMNVFHEKETME